MTENNPLANYNYRPRLVGGGGSWGLKGLSFKELSVQKNIRLLNQENIRSLVYNTMNYELFSSHNCQKIV